VNQAALPTRPHRVHPRYVVLTITEDRPGDDAPAPRASLLEEDADALAAVDPADRLREKRRNRDDRHLG
jgi:hypothetical protein